MNDCMEWTVRRLGVAPTHSTTLAAVIITDTFTSTRALFVITSSSGSCRTRRRLSFSPVQRRRLGAVASSAKEARRRDGRSRSDYVQRAISSTAGDDALSSVHRTDTAGSATGGESFEFYDDLWRRIWCDAKDRGKIRMGRGHP